MSQLRGALAQQYPNQINSSINLNVHQYLNYCYLSLAPDDHEASPLPTWQARGRHTWHMACQKGGLKWR